MIVAPSAPEKVMSWPSMLGSFAGTDNGLRATGDGDAEGDAAGEAAGLATGDGLAAAAGLAAADGLAAVAGLAAGDEAGAAVGLGAAGAVVGCAAGCEQPSASSSVAALPRPPQ